jgi:hypothetical protein
MKRMTVWKFSGLACLLLISFTLLAGMTTHKFVEDPGTSFAQDTCSDRVEDCKLPVRFVGDKDGCACFACEHGKKTQRLVCTKDETNKRLLFQKVRDSSAGYR